MKQKQTMFAVMVGTMVLAVACGRKEPPLVVDPTAPAASSAVPASPEPVRESAWKPVPVAASPTKAAPIPVTAPPNARVPAPVAASTPAPVAASAPPPAPVTTPAPEPVPPPVQAKPAPVQQTAVAPPPQPMQVTLAAGSIVPVRVRETLTSEQNETGDSWTGTLAEPLVIDGMVIAEKGASVEGRVSNAVRAGRVKGVAQLSVSLTRINTADGQRIAVHTSPFATVGKDETKRDVGKVAIASGIGAAIGAIAGRGKGAAIGAGAGAAAGTGAVMVMRGGPARIPSETLIRFRVADAVTITEKIK